MKKIIAILMSIIMLLGIGTMCSFAAEDESPEFLIPDFPAQTEGCIYFASETAYVKAGETVDIPVYMVSNYETETSGDTLIGLNVSISSYGVDYFDIVHIDYSDTVKALPGFTPIVSEVKTFEDTTINSVIFRVNGTDILKEEKVPVAVVTVAVADTYPGGDLDCILDLQAAQYYWYENDYTWYSQSPVEIWSPIDESGVTEQLEIVNYGDNDNPGIFFVSGHIIERPDTPSFADTAKAWLIEMALKITTYLMGILEVIQGLLLTA